MQGLEPIVRGLRHQRRTRALVATALVLLASAVFLLGAPPIRWPVSVALTLASALPLLLSLPSPYNDVAIRALRDTPERIVWHYLTHRHRRGAHVATTMTLALADGQRLHVDIAKEDEASAVALVRSRAPQARFGFSDDTEQIFNEDPPSIRTVA